MDAYGNITVDGLIDVDQSGRWNVSICDGAKVGICGGVTINRVESFVSVPVKTPFAINLSQVEYCKGAINPETNNYEIKVCFCSGHELWLGGEAAMGLLEQMDAAGHKRVASANLAEKYKAKM